MDCYNFILKCLQEKLSYAKFLKNNSKLLQPNLDSEIVEVEGAIEYLAECRNAIHDIESVRAAIQLLKQF